VDLYFAALTAALAAAGLGLAAALIARMGDPCSRALDRIAIVSGLEALPLALVSSVAHGATGHAPGSPAPMTRDEFLTGHPAFALAALLAAAVLWIRRRASGARATRPAPPPGVESWAR
jgi:hypothetical protein